MDVEFIREGGHVIARRYAGSRDGSKGYKEQIHMFNTSH